jgi:hypothetical protein
MRFFKHVSLLAAVFPLALAQYATPLPPDSTPACSSGEYHCANNTLQVCGDDVTWQTIKECSKTAYCFAQETVGGGGDCYPLVGGSHMQCSTVKNHRCDASSLQECGDHGYWSIVKNCTQTAYCFAQDTVNGKGDCHPLIVGNNNQCSTTDTHRCSQNTLQICGYHGYWKASKNCTQTAYCFAQDTIDGGSGCHPLVAGLKEQCSVANEHRCQNNTIQLCTNHGYWRTTKTCIDSEKCSLNSKSVDGGLCLPADSTGDQDRCKASAHRCHHHAIQDCSLRMHWSTRQTCGEHQICLENCSHSGCKPECYTVSIPRRNDTAYDVTGSDRCLYTLARIQTCSKSLWVDKEPCTKDADCIEHSSDGRNWTATCVGLPLKSCDRPGNERCLYPPATDIARIQSCTDNLWIDKEICSANAICWADKNFDTGNESVACVAMPTSRYSSSPTCTPGDLTCDANLYPLRKCSANGEWETIKKCLTPGDRSIDRPGQAHCKSGGMDSPKLRSKRVYSTCAPGSLACDKDRRFLFTCGTDGKWKSDSLQCFDAGFCRPEGSFALTCGGFPVYDGENGVCNSHCESMDYLYCIGGNWDEPDVIQKCLKGMCQREDVRTPYFPQLRVHIQEANDDEQCRGCDRCNFKMPYGNALRPDLSTVVRPRA